MRASVAILIAASLLPALAAAQKVAICDDEAEFPPYAYRSGDPLDPSRNIVVGAMVELAAAVFRELHLPHSYELIPWKRCIAEVERFPAGAGYEVASNGSYSEEREKRFYMTVPVFRRQTGLWFSTRRFPKGSPILLPEDLNRWRVCGALGYNYDWLQALGVREIDTGAASPHAAMQKLALGRCDFVIAGLEDTHVAHRMYRFRIPDSVQGVPFPGGRRPTYHFWIARGSPRGRQLQEDMNRAILKLQADGTADAIFRKHLLEGDGL